ncbi:MAG: sporulation protein YabP [Clostridia bacterium]|nr:sporulation protein YabP [Clostridia bacterium]
MNGAKEGQVHGIALEMRKHMEITGVREVVSFDDVCVVLKTVCGELTAEGKEMKINILDTERGVVTLDGKVDAIFYTDTTDTPHRGLFGKLLK